MRNAMCLITLVMLEAAKSKKIGTALERYSYCAVTASTLSSDLVFMIHTYLEHHFSKYWNCICLSIFLTQLNISGWGRLYFEKYSLILYVAIQILIIFSFDTLTCNTRGKRELQKLPFYELHKIVNILQHSRALLAFI